MIGERLPGGPAGIGPVEREGRTACHILLCNQPRLTKLTSMAGLRPFILILLIVLGASPVSGAVGGDLVDVQKGDGIYSLLARYGISGSDAMKEFIRINRDELGPDNTLILGRQYRLPELGKTLLQPLFGPRYERVKVIDDRLADASFYLVSGHGGPDTGAIGKEAGYNLYEDEYAYDITLRLGRRLMEHGARVHFIIIDRTQGIRDQRYLDGNTSELCHPSQPIPRNQRERLQQRADAVNRLYHSEKNIPYRRCIVIHIDSRSSWQGIDTFFYHSDISETGRRMAETLRGTFEEMYQRHQPGRGYAGTVVTRHLFMVDHTVPPTVFIEVGNIQHERDQERILSPGNRQAVATWLAQGILQDHKDNP